MEGKQMKHSKKKPYNLQDLDPFPNSLVVSTI